MRQLTVRVSAGMRVLGLSIVLLPGCGGASPLGGSGGASGTGGTVLATGGTTSSAGGASGTGGANGAGGASGTGGAVIATGGTTSGSGGSSNELGFEEVRCYRHSASGEDYCSGRLGNLWALVGPVCSFGEPHQVMDLNATECAGIDDATGWDETFCDDVACYGRLGDWVTQLAAPCQLPGADTSSATPSELLCDAAPESPAGWQDVECFTIPIGSGDLIDCYGFHGQYFPARGLFPTCSLSTYEDDPAFAEIAPSAAACD